MMDVSFDCSFTDSQRQTAVRILQAGISGNMALVAIDDPTEIRPVMGLAVLEGDPQHPDVTIVATLDLENGARMQAALENKGTEHGQLH